MSRSNSEKKLGTGRVVAVAIENNKTSQYAAKWAVDNLLPKDQCLLLIHVRQRTSSISTPTGSQISVDANDDVARAYKQQMYNESRELFATFRVFCNRKNIQCQEILLEDTDVPKALMESVNTYSIELMVLGAPSKSGLVRRFRTTDVPNQVSKGAPPFCTVYIISKGKISTVKSATVQLTNTKATILSNTLQPQNQLSPSPDIMDAQLMQNHPPRRMPTYL
ncbi:putative rossmann-like alpha/beta/alpha sandwich protein [Lupinus albus]|uniref:RING-type E3 ubiquitin transferase n=1 Tax=Lupinus albus TaxID=3870 RepID=A0A6A4QIP6_LUPAL|nr:putative rossmann-like alpha/beta/alpha sandwich protein [Lupinus albus]